LNWIDVVTVTDTFGADIAVLALQTVGHVVDAFQAVIIFDVVLGEAGEAYLLGALCTFVVVESAGFALVVSNIISRFAFRTATDIALSTINEILRAEAA
jgi:hypothetical protein